MTMSAKELRALQLVWYGKLRDQGFQDCEDPFNQTPEDRKAFMIDHHLRSREVAQKGADSQGDVAWRCLVRSMDGARYQTRAHRAWAALACDGFRAKDIADRLPASPSAGSVSTFIRDEMARAIAAHKLEVETEA